MRRGFWLAILLVSLINVSNAQRLNYLAPVINRSLNTDTGKSIILTTGDGARFRGISEKIPYTSSVQVIDVDQPWPPRWYTTTPVYTDEMYKMDTSNGRYHLYMLMDVRIVGGYFSFYKILSNPGINDGPLMNCEFAGYLLLNNKMEAVDTVKSSDAIRNLYFHDLSINSKGEKLVNLRKDTYLDLRDYSNDYRDTAVHCNVDYLQILDPVSDTITFNWNPLDHIHGNLFQFKEILKERAWGTGKASVIEWTRLTSAQFDYDGNIIYDMKKIGLGKISREHGGVMWQITYRDIPMVAGTDTIRWYNPHDFNFLWEDDTSATYSVFSNGTKLSERGHQELACGVVFQMHKTTRAIKLIKVLWPRKKYVGDGQGNISYSKSGDYVMGYGNFDQGTVPNDGFEPNLEYGQDSVVKGIYEFPKYNRTYKAHLLGNFPRPPRPGIIIKGDKLLAVGDFTDWVWYELSGDFYSEVKVIGKGPTVNYEKGKNYCVEGKYGIGYSVSKRFNGSVNEPY